MPGCLDRCYLYLEEHSMNHLNFETQKKVEIELKKFRNRESYDFTVLKDVVKRRCLGDYLKDENDLPTNCKHYWELPEEELSTGTRMAILEGKKNKKWKAITLIVSIAGIAFSAFFAYLNFNKPSAEDLNNEIATLKEQVQHYEEEIAQREEIIEKLRRIQEKNIGGDK